MNIQAISGMSFMAKAPTSGIKQVGELSTYSREMLNRCYGEVENLAKNFNKQVKIAQSGDVLLVNSGSVTSTFNPEKLANPSRDFGQGIMNNIKANVIAEERGLKKGIEYIEINTPPEIVGSKLNTLA